MAQSTTTTHRSIESDNSSGEDEGIPNKQIPVTPSLSSTRNRKRKRGNAEEHLTERKHHKRTPVSLNDSDDEDLDDTIGFSFDKINKKFEQFGQDRSAKRHAEAHSQIQAHETEDENRADAEIYHNELTEQHEEPLFVSSEEEQDPDYSPRDEEDGGVSNEDDEETLNDEDDVASNEEKEIEDDPAHEKHISTDDANPSLRRHAPSSNTNIISNQSTSPREEGKPKQTAKPTLTNPGHAAVDLALSKSASTKVAEAASIAPAQAGQRQGNPLRRRCEDFETLILNEEESMYTAEIAFDVMDEMIKLIGGGEWTGGGMNWMDQFLGGPEVDQDYEGTLAGDLGVHLLSILGMCNKYQEMSDPLEQLQYMGHLDERDEATIAGQVSVIRQRHLPEVISDDSAPDGRGRDLVNYVIPTAVTAAYAIFLSGESPEGSRVFHPMGPLKVLKELTSIIIELNELVGPERDHKQHFSDLCLEFKEDIAKTMENVGVAVVSTRAAVLAEQKAQRSAVAKAAACRQREAQFVASIQTFLGHEDESNNDDSCSPSPLLWEQKCNRLLKELRGASRPNVAAIAYKIDCSREEVWEMIDAVKAEAEEAQEEDGIAIPPDLARAFGMLYD